MRRDLEEEKEGWTMSSQQKISLQRNQEEGRDKKWKT